MLSLPDEVVLTTTSRYLRAAGMTLAHSWATADDSSFLPSPFFLFTSLQPFIYYVHIKVLF